jgi:hypothetical protein
MKKLTIKDKEGSEDVLDYWKNKTPEERVSTVELLREQFYIIQGYKSIPRLTHVINLIDG